MRIAAPAAPRLQADFSGWLYGSVVWSVVVHGFSYGVIVINRIVAAISIVILQTVALGQSALDQAESRKPMEICDLFLRLDSFDGKQVAVRGVYRFSMELAGLYSEGCEQPLTLDGVERAQALDTEFSGKSPEGREEYAHFNEVVNTVMKSGGREAIHVTFIGTLITRNPNLHRVGKRKGERMFGHLGVYPARLDVIRIQNIAIEDEARRPSNMGLRK